MKHIEIAYEYFKILKKKLKNELITFAVYGSVAREEAKRKSDIDVFIIVEKEKESYYEQILPLIEAEKELKDKIKKDFFISFVVLSKNEAKNNRWLYLDMIEDSILIYDKKDFFKKILEKLRRKLKKMGARRVRINKQKWYWELKPDLKPGEIFKI